MEGLQCLFEFQTHYWVIVVNSIIFCYFLFKWLIQCPTACTSVEVLAHRLVRLVVSMAKTWHACLIYVYAGESLYGPSCAPVMGLFLNLNERNPFLSISSHKFYIQSDGPRVIDKRSFVTNKLAFCRRNQILHQKSQRLMAPMFFTTKITPEICSQCRKHKDEFILLW